MNSTQADEHSALAAAELSAGYSVQGLSVVTLALGLASPLALGRTIFWAIPLVTVVLGIVSLRSLATHPEKCGRTVAVCGILLALFFGTWAPARYITRYNWLTGQAREYADAWVSLLQQRKFREAHQLHGTRGQRAAEGTPLEEFYHNDKQGMRDYAMFFSAAPLESIVASTEPIEARFDQVELVETARKIDQIVLRYSLTIKESGRSREIPLRVIMRRVPDGETNDHQWFVEGARDY